MALPDLYEENEVETIAKAYEIVCNISRAVAVYDCMLKDYDAEKRIFQKKSELSMKLSEYDELVKMFQGLPDKVRSFPMLRNAKSELDKKVQEVTTKYGLVSAISA